MRHERYVRDVSELLNATREFTGNDRAGTLFRGQADSSWPLLPKAGRSDYSDRDWRARFDTWCERARASWRLPSDDWKRLALAQHHGLAGPLLDWSTNPLVAAFFATTEPSVAREDGVIYVFEPVVQFDPTAQGGGSIESFDRFLSLHGDRRVPFPTLFIPPFQKRLLAQQAAFTFHSKPSLDMSRLEWPIEHRIGRDRRVESLAALRVPSSKKAAMARQLEKCGITRARLFPDLDGLSEHVNRAHSGDLAAPPSRRDDAPVEHKHHSRRRRLPT